MQNRQAFRPVVAVFILAGLKLAHVSEGLQTFART